MKPIMLLLTASLAVVAAAPAALAQGRGDACSSGYGSCMDRCSTRPQSLQESCSQSCEGNTNRCYEGLYGRAPQGGVSSQASSPPAAAEPEARAARDQAKPAEAPKRR